MNESILILGSGIRKEPRNTRNTRNKRLRPEGSATRGNCRHAQRPVKSWMGVLLTVDRRSRQSLLELFDSRVSDPSYGDVEARQVLEPRLLTFPRFTSFVTPPTLAPGGRHGRRRLRYVHRRVSGANGRCHRPLRSRGLRPAGVRRAGPPDCRAGARSVASGSLGRRWRERGTPT